MTARIRCELITFERRVEKHTGTHGQKTLVLFALQFCVQKMAVKATIVHKGLRLNRKPFSRQFDPFEFPPSIECFDADTAQG